MAGGGRFLKTEVPVHFSFARMPRLEFGCGAIARVPSLVGEGRSVVALVTGASSFAADSRRSVLLEAFKSNGTKTLEFSCAGEPSVDFVDASREALEDLCEKRGADVGSVTVVAVGGGSAMDAGKAIAAMLGAAATAAERGEAALSVKEYLEGVGSRSPSGETATLIACPTTAGTGSEATKNAVISRIGQGGFKKSLRHENYVPAIAVIDPELALGCPRPVTASSGLDALTQLMEAWTSPATSPITASLCESGVAAFARSFDRVLADGGDLESRSGMAYAAFLSGVGLANAGLGAVHALASPLGGRFTIPHGVVCGTLLLSATRLNIERLKSLGPEGEAALRRYAHVGYLLSARGRAGAGTLTDAGVGTTESLSYGLGLLLDELERLEDLADLPLLGSFGVTEADLPSLAAAAATKTNPVALAASDYETLLRSRL